MGRWFDWFSTSVAEFYPTEAEDEEYWSHAYSNDTEHGEDADTEYRDWVRDQAPEMPMMPTHFRYSSSSFLFKKDFALKSISKHDSQPSPSPTPTVVANTAGREEFPSNPAYNPFNQDGPKLQSPLLPKTPPEQKPESTAEPARIPYLVTWHGPKDPDNPKNWSSWKKRGVLLCISLFAFLSPMSSSILAPALDLIAKDLVFSSMTESSIALSIYILGFAFGPLLLAPMSEVYGRFVVLQSSMLVYLVANFICGFSPNKETLIIFRFISGMGGSAPLVVGTGVISDCWLPKERGKAVAVWGLGPLLGPAIGPLVGGFVVQAISWRWLFWVTCIAEVVVQITSLFLLPETYAAKILKKRLWYVQKGTGNPNFHLAPEFNSDIRTLLKTALQRPFILLGTQPIIQLIACYMAYIFGLFYLILASFPSVWQGVYHEQVQIAGLNYLSLGIGYVAGALINAFSNDRIYQSLKAKNGGQPRPEFRMPLTFVGAILMPIGLFMYGWTAQTQVLWIAPNVGIAIFACGSVFCLQCLQTYVIDCYNRFAASGMAAAVVLRSIAGFLFPLFSPSLYSALGLGWGTSVLGFVGILIGIPAPLIFWYYGQKLRNMSKYAANKK